MSALTLAAWMDAWGLNWIAVVLMAAAAVYVVGPFVISQLCAAFVLLCAHSRIRAAGGLDALVDALTTPERLREEARRLRAAGNQELAKDFEQAASTIEKNRG
jgi:hypothetical protein